MTTLVTVSPYDPELSAGSAGGVFLRAWVQSMAQAFNVHLITFDRRNNSRPGSVTHSSWGGVEVWRAGIPAGSPVGRLAAGLGPPMAFRSMLAERPLLEILRGGDIIECQWPSSVRAVRVVRRLVGRRTPISYVTHDLRSEALASLVMRSTGVKPRVAALAKLPIAAWQETTTLRQSNLVMCFRADEARAINILSRARTMVVSPTLPAESKVDITDARPGVSATFGFLGDLSRSENIYSLKWFLSRVWSDFHASNPSCVFRIAGGGLSTSDRISLQQSGVLIDGWVDSLPQFYSSLTCSIAPLRVRGGLKFKVLESLAYGVPVLASSTAGRGYDIGGGGLWICSSPLEWKNAMRRLALGHGDPERAKRAQEYRAAYDWERSIHRVQAAYNDAVESSRGPQ